MTQLPPAATRALVVLAVAAVATGWGACGGSDDEARRTTTSTTTAGPGDTTTTSPPSDPAVAAGPFCTSVQAIRDLGGDTGDAAADAVLAQNERLLDLLDEATASVPEGAPADVEALFDDYRTIAQAIGAAEGDVDAAYASIQATDPALAARLFNATAHLPAFDFFERECGVRLQ